MIARALIAIVAEQNDFLTVEDCHRIEQYTRFWCYQDILHPNYPRLDAIEGENVLNRPLLPCSFDDMVRYLGDDSELFSHMCKLINFFLFVSKYDVFLDFRMAHNLLRNVTPTRMLTSVGRHRLQCFAESLAGEMQNVFIESATSFKQHVTKNPGLQYLLSVTPSHDFIGVQAHDCKCFSHCHSLTCYRLPFYNVCF